MNKKKIIIGLVGLLVLVLIALVVLLNKSDLDKTKEKAPKAEDAIPADLDKRMEKYFGEKVMIPTTQRAEITHITTEGSEKNKVIEITYGTKQKEKKKAKDSKKEVVYGDYTKETIAVLEIRNRTEELKEAETMDVFKKEVIRGIGKRTSTETEVFYLFNKGDYSYKFTFSSGDKFDEFDAKLFIETIVRFENKK